jgi:hypothetical protein
MVLIAQKLDLEALVEPRSRCDPKSDSGVGARQRSVLAP